jgi:AmmeMemoRadiSam system protein A
VPYTHELNDHEKRELLRIARATLREYFSTGVIPPGAPHRPCLVAPAGAFVSLHKGKELRGCIGTFAETTPLYRAIQEMAISAATRDPRFEPLLHEELIETDIEISVLSGLTPVGSPPEGIEIGRHGLHVTKGFLRGVLLPQVAVTSGWTAEEFLCETCKKAGLDPLAWRAPQAIVEVFSAQVFSERDLRREPAEGRP